MEGILKLSGEANLSAYYQLLGLQSNLFIGLAPSWQKLEHVYSQILLHFEFSHRTEKIT